MTGIGDEIEERDLQLPGAPMMDLLEPTLT